MPDHATELLLNERINLRKQLRALDHEFCSVPTYKQWKNGIEPMTVEEYEYKEKELQVKLFSVEHVLAMCCIKGRNEN